MGWKSIAQWLGDRMREPSSYAGLAILLTSVHMANADSWAKAVMSLGMGVGGIIAIIIPETGAKQ